MKCNTYVAQISVKAVWKYIWTSDNCHQSQITQPNREMPANNDLIVFQKPKPLHKQSTLNEREEIIDDWKKVSFAHLPIELFIEVLMYLRPKKLITIACCSKTLNELVLAS